MTQKTLAGPDTDLIPFLQRFSTADQNCLPEDANTEGHIIMMPDQGGQVTSSKLMECLTSEGQFDLYLTQARHAGQALSKAEQRCIGDCIKQMMVQTESETMKENKFSRIMLAMIISSTAVTTHCAGFETLGDVPKTPAEQAELTHLTCLIEQTGSPAPFIKRLLDDDKAIEQMAKK